MSAPGHSSWPQQVFLGCFKDDGFEKRESGGREALSLPCTAEGRPNWAYMERYVRGLPCSGNLAPAAS